MQSLKKYIFAINAWNEIYVGSKALSTRIRIFSNPQLFLSGYGYLPHASGEFDNESGEFDSESGKKINPLSRVEKNKSTTNPITCGRVNPDIKSDYVKSVSNLSPNNKPIWRNNVSGEQSKFPATISLYGACSEDMLVQRNLGY